MKNTIFYIYSSGYDEKIGGSIVLHRLCDLINNEGGKAYLYPMRPHFKLSNPVYSLLDVATYFLNEKKNFKVHSTLNTPVASLPIEKNGIIVYPEIVSGNPVNLKKVVRWLLHKPGFHTGIIEFNPSDLIFYFQEAFNAHGLSLNNGGKLQILHLRLDIYKRTNYGERTGTCYLLRKGKGRKIVHDLNDSILIDDLSHGEIANIFNRVERFISYDSYTLYSQYAAACGCVSIVVPENCIDKETWQPVEELRYGISYGFDEIQWAKNTQEKVITYLEAQENNSIHSVRNFIAACDRHFF